LRERAAEDVGRAAGGKTDDQLHRLAWIGLGQREQRRKQQKQKKFFHEVNL
jgi:hypothetical protein